jgi:hypothetical protein
LVKKLSKLRNLSSSGQYHVFSAQVLNTDENLSLAYSDLFAAKLADCLTTKKLEKSLPEPFGLVRAFEILRLSAAQVEDLLGCVVRNTEPTFFGRQNASVACVILANLIQLHGLHFMDVLFRPETR